MRLTPTEWHIVEMLVRNAGKLVTQPGNDLSRAVALSHLNRGALDLRPFRVVGAAFVADLNSA